MEYGAAVELSNGFEPISCFSLFVLVPSVSSASNQTRNTLTCLVQQSSRLYPKVIIQIIYFTNNTHSPRHLHFSTANITPKKTIRWQYCKNVSSNSFFSNTETLYPTMNSVVKSRRTKHQRLYQEPETYDQWGTKRPIY